MPFREMLGRSLKPDCVPEPRLLPEAQNSQ
jgi:hypothetical protein